jgi:hypothetical protein
MVTRADLIERFRDRLSRRGAPRLQLLFIVALAGTVAFLISAAGLGLGLASMTVRYPLAAACGYLAFIALTRAWIAWQRGRWDSDFDIEPEFLNLDVPPDETSDLELFQGGRSGGGGASGGWSAESSSAASSKAPGGSHVDVDLDELWPIALAAVCAVGALIAILYVVYAAPLLLAEVALDGAVVATLYRRMRRADSAHWESTTLRRTWLPAVVLVASATIAGFAFERIAPDARSIGGVIREIISATR